MRIRDLIHHPGRDPLLKVGAWAMVVAFGFAVVVAVGASLDRPIEVAAARAATSEPEPAADPLVRTDPGINPWVERDIPPPKPKVTTKPQPAPQPEAPTPDPPSPDPQPPSAPEPAKKPSPQNPQPDPRRAPTPDANNPPAETQVEATQATRRSNQQATRTPRYHLPPGAIMTLTIPSLGLENTPVINSEAKGALDRGVVHLPDTSLPWSETPERNVYLAGHRLGWPGTGSHLVFYRLDELTGGERVSLRGPAGESYDYRVLESFVVGPEDGWVTGRVRGRDLLTLQTCTPLPTFERRLIVRAERV